MGRTIEFLIVPLLLLSLGEFSKANLDDPSCSSKIYCQGDLLRVVQTSRVFDDSKDFVDQKMLYDEATILENFNAMMSSNNNEPSREIVKAFVKENFAEGDELIPWSLPDYNESPSLLYRLSNQSYKNFATGLIKKWPTLARQIKQEVHDNPERFSLIPMPNGFVIPGGRFKEIYYWDTYWIVKGLLISEMPETARLVLENFLHIVNVYGFIPNGARVYYLNRSHPPLLTPMVYLYFKDTGNVEWLRANIHLLDKELKWFLNNRITNIEKNGVTYSLAQYDSHSGSPRPESYLQDVETCESLENEERIKECYADLKAGAESGWDFSFRWIFDEFGGNNANRTQIQTRRVIPVDLNAMLALAFKNLASMYRQLDMNEKYTEYRLLFIQWRRAITDVLYNSEKGIWFDYDLKLGKQRELFYPSNVAPLWAAIYDVESAKSYGKAATEYLLEEGIHNFYGGIPTSLNNTGEQWDYPSAWAPLQSIVIGGLKSSGDENALMLANALAGRWVDSNMIGWESTGEMYEKYDCEHPGKNGGGGEYVVQTGFGWSNGAALELLNDFFTS